MTENQIDRIARRFVSLSNDTSKSASYLADVWPDLTKRDGDALMAAIVREYQNIENDAQLERARFGTFF